MSAAMGAGAAANFVGGLIQAIAAARAQREMFKEFEDEQGRQQKYQGEAFDIFQPAVRERGVERAREQIQTGAEGRKKAFSNIGQVELAGDKLGGRDLLNFDLLAQNRAQLGGYSDWALDQMISNLRAQDKLNRISNFSAGTARVFPYRMQDAEHSQDQLAAIGGLISSIGGSAPAWGQMFKRAPQATNQSTLYGLGDYGQGFGQEFSNYA